MRRAATKIATLGVQIKAADHAVASHWLKPPKIVPPIPINKPASERKISGYRVKTCGKPTSPRFLDWNILFGAPVDL
jgi:hypothetical protein